MAAVHQSAGVSEGDKFSCEDASRLYRKVFCDACTEDEVRTAVKKLSESDSEESCVGERILDVLIEIKRMKEKKEKLYWEVQLLNAGHLEELHLCETSAVADAPVLKCPHRTTQTRAKEDMSGVWQLHKAARQSWARVVTEGVQSILACPWPVLTPGVRGEVWGWVSCSDVLLFNEVKYDAVTRLLYDDMLLKHHSGGGDDTGIHAWEALSPWRRHQEELWLEELAQEALASDDMVALAELPGAFTIYRVCPESSFTAVSLLYKLNACRRQEREELTALVERLDEESLRLLCLYIRSATLEAQREKTAYDAYLAVRQSWHKWPQVHSPCREERAAALLRGDDDIFGHMKDDDDLGLSQQSLLPLLVLTQQQERKQLVRLLHGVTLADVQRPAPSDSLKTSCIKRLQQICSRGENQPDCDFSSPPPEWTEDQLERAALVLLVDLLEIQERDTSTFLRGLLDGNEHLQKLRQEYQSEVHAQHLRTNLLQLFNPDASSSTSHANLSGQGQVPQQSRGAAEAQNFTTGLLESQTAADTIGTRHDGVQSEDVPDKQGVCADSSSKVDGGGPDDEEQDNKTKNCEDQDSLITLAWSTRLKGNAGHDGEAAHAVDVQVQPCGEGGTPEHAAAECREGVISQGQLAEQHRGPVELNSDESDKENDLHTKLVCGQQTLADSRDRKTTDEDSDMVKELRASEPTAQATGHCSLSERSAWREGARPGEPMSAVEREKTMRKLVDVHRRVERKQQRDRDRQQLRVQERLSIIQSRKADEDLFGPKQRERMRHLSKDIPQEKSQQKTLVREQLEQLKRERSFIMQSRRKRNTAGFKELLAPVHLQSRGTEDRLDQDNGLE